MKKTFRVKVEGTQAEVDAFINSIPQNYIKQVSGTLPKRNMPRVHAYVNIYSNHYTGEHDNLLNKAG